MSFSQRVGTRTDVMLFAQDILRHAGLVQVEQYPSSGYWSVGLSDGDGARIAITGDRSSLAMIMSAALQQLRPPDPDPDPDPPAEEAAA